MHGEEEEKGDLLKSAKKTKLEGNLKKLKSEKEFEEFLQQQGIPMDAKQDTTNSADEKKIHSFVEKFQGLLLFKKSIYYINIF